MVSMKKTKSEEKEPMEYKEPEYPYGLHISLDKSSIKKLGVSGDVGDECVFVIKTKITDKHMSDSEHGSDKNLGLQITDMEKVEQEDADETLKKWYK